MSNNDTARSIARPSLVRPLSYQNNVEEPKSRLIQPRYSTRSSLLISTQDQASDKDEPLSPAKVSRGIPEATNSAAGTSTESTISTRLRPRSMYQTGSATSQRAEQGAKSSSQSMRPPAPVKKLPEPQSSGLGRTQSLRKPGIPSQSHRPPGAAHSRTQSVNAAAVTRKDTTKPGTTVERPRSLVGASGTSHKTNPSLTDAAITGGSVPSRLAGLRRAASVKAKPQALSSNTEMRPPSRPEETTHRDNPPEGPKKTGRPAFSTLQQHFTPRKAGKAPTATFLHPAPVTGHQTLPPEVSNLQTELLQLHLLHQSCDEVQRRWELSAKRRFRTRFEEVSSLHQTMLEHERAGQEQKNMQSLLDWSSGSSSTGLAEHIQALSEPLHELPSLVEPGGRIHKLVSEFEHWSSWVQEVRHARQDASGDMAGTRTIEGLGDSWKAESAVLVRKLTSFARALDSLEVPAAGSSLLCIVDSCKALLGGILEELQTMQTLEVDLVTKEKFWVEDRLKLIARAIGTFPTAGEEESAAWRN